MDRRNLVIDAGLVLVGAVVGGIAGAVSQQVVADRAEGKHHIHVAASAAERNVQDPAYNFVIIENDGDFSEKNVVVTVEISSIGARVRSEVMESRPIDITDRIRREEIELYGTPDYFDRKIVKYYIDNLNKGIFIDVYYGTTDWVNISIEVTSDEFSDGDYSSA